MSSLRFTAPRKSRPAIFRPSAASALLKTALPAALIGCGLAFSPAHALEYCTDGTGLCVKDAQSTVSGQTFSGYSNAAIRFQPDADGLYLISDSVFERNSAENGGAVVFLPGASATLTIRDSEFRNNKAETDGGSVFTHASYENSDSKVVLNIVAESKDVLFEQNYAGASLGHTDPEDFRCVDTTINLYAAEGKKISFDGVIKTESLRDTPSGLSINQSGETYSYLDPVTGSIKTVEAQTGGEVVFGSSLHHSSDNSENDCLDVRLYGGTVTLLGTHDTLNTTFAGISLTVEGEATLRGREATPLSASDYTVSSKSEAHAEALSLANATNIQTIILAEKLRLKSSLMIQPAVDLSAATLANGAVGSADTYSLADPNSSPDGSGMLVVSGWIIKAENNDLASVTVDLAEDASLRDKGVFALGESAAVALGPVYVWTVAQKEQGSSVFIFTKAENEDQYFTPDPASDDEVKDPDPDNGDAEDPKEEEKDENTGSADSGSSDTEDSDSGSDAEDTGNADEDTGPDAETGSGSSAPDTPFNYNPDVYGGEIAALGVTVIQHAVSDAVFSEAGLNGAAAPERRQWWGTVRGADLNLKTKNFYGTEYDYALAIVGHNFEPRATAAGSLEFGAYLGAATGSAKYSKSKVRQNGGFAGGSVVLKNGAAFVGAQAAFGVMNNRLRGNTDTSFTTPWFGAGATAGFAFDVPAADLTLTPRINLSYVRVTGRSYTTGLGATVENAALHAFETSPSVRLDKRFGAGWSAFGEARYAFVSKNGGRSTASYGSNVSALPAVADKNYAEYGIGIRKETKNAGVSLNVSRADGGRSGWAGSLRADFRF
jgi:outer membrane autotransporter protein